MRRIINMLFHRVVLTGLAILIQVIILLLMIVRFQRYFVLFYLICVLISLLVVIHIVSDTSNPSYKITWIILIMLFPIFGGIVYLMFGSYKLSKRSKKKLMTIYNKTNIPALKDNELLEKLEKIDKSAYLQANYICNSTNLTIYQNTYTEYLEIGEVYFSKLLEELRKAKKYIFMEYFIIEQGVMLNKILDVLESKVKEGLDVRIMYDDLGCIMKIPANYKKVLEKKGIKVCVFNPFIPFLKPQMNNRDHRKIVIIDGHTAFTGGINLADEYINEKNLYGHWKDNGIMVKGSAVFSFSLMFLSVWDYYNNDNTNYYKYKKDAVLDKKYEASGYVVPFLDSPIDNENIGENIYLNMINSARDYIYITTPYLIIDNEMITALTLAAKNGVDVRVVTPYVSDGKIVDEVTKSYYKQLLESGVKIYEYTPGFIHMKTFLADDKIAVVGTVNMDYRSLYLHFECGVWLYKTNSIKDINNDFGEIFRVSKNITLNDINTVRALKRLKRAILRIVAPLM